MRMKASVAAWRAGIELLPKEEGVEEGSSRSQTTSLARAEVVVRTGKNGFGSKAAVAAVEGLEQSWMVDCLSEV